MFEDDDLKPQRVKPAPKKLDSLSVDELNEMIADLKDEILRIEAEIKRKKASVDAASLFFKR